VQKAILSFIYIGNPFQEGQSPFSINRIRVLWAQVPVTSGFLVGSTLWPRMDQAEGEKMESPLGLGLGTKLGLLGHFLTCIGLHTRLWSKIWVLLGKVLGT